jgi:hypothetical protein
MEINRFPDQAPAARWIFTLVMFFPLLLSACYPLKNLGETKPGSAGLSVNSTRGPKDSLAATFTPGSSRSTTLLPTSDLSSLLTPSPAPVIEGMFNFPDNVNPLTGLVVDDPSRLERRPVMVKVSNFPRTGRPHAGLSFADMVFEYYIGFGMNRFMAIYLGQDCSQVGPVRSGRLVDAQLGEMYQGLLFYGDADPQVDKVIVAELGPRALAEKFLPTPPKYRLGKILDETSLYVNTAELTDYVNQKNEVTNSRRDLRGMIFSNLIHPVNKPATQLGVQFWTTTRGEWKYDATTGKYLRWSEDVKGDNQIEMIPLVDRLNDQQLAFSNIIILYATYIEYAPTLHDIRMYDNTQGKKAIFFRDGVMIEGTWKTVSNGRPIQFFNSWGLPMHLKPGNTWIVLTGDSSKFTETDPATWELRFDLP